MQLLLTSFTTFPRKAGPLTPRFSLSRSFLERDVLKGLSNDGDESSVWTSFPEVSVATPSTASGESRVDREGKKGTLIVLLGGKRGTWRVFFPLEGMCERDGKLDDIFDFCFFLALHVWCWKGGILKLT